MKEEILREKDVLKNDDQMIGGAIDSEQEDQDGPTDGQAEADGFDKNQHVKSSNLFEKLPADTINNSSENGTGGPIEANELGD